jgi:hypothetical protein
MKILPPVPLQFVSHAHIRSSPNCIVSSCYLPAPRGIQAAAAHSSILAKSRPRRRCAAPPEALLRCTSPHPPHLRRRVVLASLQYSAPPAPVSHRGLREAPDQGGKGKRQGGRQGLCDCEDFCSGGEDFRFLSTIRENQKC